MGVLIAQEKQHGTWTMKKRRGQQNQDRKEKNATRNEAATEDNIYSEQREITTGESSRAAAKFPARQKGSDAAHENLRSAA